MDDGSTSFVPGPSPVVAIPVQHHHAHLAACLAENGVEGPALGVTWDGTGYGTDGTIWGGEFLLGDAAEFTRVAHLRPFRLPGGEAAVKEPRRAALALLWELYGGAALERDDLAPIQAFRPAERRLLGQMLSRDINTPVTTSAGRLFDGVAALLGLHQQVTFEGQAAMALEFIADGTVDEAYPIAIRQNDDGRQTTDDGKTSVAHRLSSVVLDWQPLIEAILADLHQGLSPSMMSARFHNALVEAILAVAEHAGERRVSLIGGCFQNRLLTERATRRLNEAGFEVLLHRQVPPNDGGISLGQVVVAAAQLEGKQ
jgi:hydrogenase maturation protein HypF